ncbi:S9 family peptidase [Formosa sediminum]|uniref:S9 family peptidase n=1 Tax=Formosa sediminum TaxID=2594004 RepID=A0A516GSR3_9FLAO|nr:prolyl oligopeptidase family serine peptidase [Formosa sediminum]QDO94554.1 S9 family peptidase [Formosa sediminum]
MKIIFTTLLVCCSLFSYAQKKALEQSDIGLWRTIDDETISPNGDFVMYTLNQGEKDLFLKIKDAKGKLIFEHDRAKNGIFTNDSKYALFTVNAWKDSITELKRKKVKKKDLPKDTLAIYNLASKDIAKIANVKSYKVPEKWSGYVAYVLEDVKQDKKKSKDSLSKDKVKDTIAKGKKKKGPKKVDKDNGYHLVLRNLITQKEDTIKYVTNFTFAKEGKRFGYTTTGETNTTAAGAYVINLENNQTTQVFSSHDQAKYYQLHFSDTGEKLGFIADLDSTKVQERPNALYVWKSGDATAQEIINNTSAPKGYRVSSDGRLSFSKNESKLYFGLATPSILKDTTLIDEEIVNVEVWTYNEPRLYTVQENNVKRDRKQSFQTVLHLDTNAIVQLGSTKYPNANIGDEGNANVALVSNPEPYELARQWTALRASDYALVNVNTGETKKIMTNIAGGMRLSPNAKYVYGYDLIDSTWVSYNINTGKELNLTKGKVFYNELNDTPNYPRSYGVAGWTENDAALLVYDRYDVWSINPDSGTMTKLTNGRASKTQYRYVELDDEARFLDTSSLWLFTTFNEDTKHSGYYAYNAKRKKGEQLVDGPYRYSKPIKALNNTDVIFTKESFTEFPNLRYSNLSFKKDIQISDANPQQKDYNWGTVELVNWTSLDGKPLTGMLVKPENFDPNKKYPMIVNFYEKSSDGLFRHKAPAYGRSTINYSFYASRGYLIFNPDIEYKDGYPGESAYNCLMPGVASLIAKGFVDQDNIGLQGHSWGGYQIAYLVTKTDLFKAVESGAPVPNMISAYGGIRWGTGLSRQFQYEHTQSRIGGTPWEYPMRYIENSPIFYLDKVNTPVLIMHNDADGHVPWYQGIEFFVGLRRLGKPSWLLNYNGEPHWPLQFQNRKDFNIRLAQFFDYYLKGAAKPMWMERGVPAIEKGINQGYELMEN